MAKVILTTFLYVSPVQMMPACDHTGGPTSQRQLYIVDDVFKEKVLRPLYNVLFPIDVFEFWVSADFHPGAVVAEIE